MAMIKCHECGQDISERANVCPKCGASNKNAQTEAIWVWVLGLVGCVAFLFLIFLWLLV
jgi:hypothetical protein